MPLNDNLLEQEPNIKMGTSANEANPAHQGVVAFQAQPWEVFTSGMWHSGIDNMSFSAATAHQSDAGGRWLSNKHIAEYAFQAEGKNRPTQQQLAGQNCWP
jgi:hypothetical protein